MRKTPKVICDISNAGLGRYAPIRKCRLMSPSAAVHVGGLTRRPSQLAGFVRRLRRPHNVPSVGCFPPGLRNTVLPVLSAFLPVCVVMGPMETWDDEAMSQGIAMPWLTLLHCPRFKVHSIRPVITGQAS